VIRILDPSSAKLGIEALGYEKIEKDRLMTAIVRPYGMVLVTGPTGSGQDGVALHLPEHPEPAGREHLHGGRPGGNQPARHQPGQRQRPAGLTFAAALKSFLRQDPDIIMVGEIRDLETADIAIKAAQTGHMVMSTLHTNDAPTTLTRLLNMGVAPFNIASSVLLITAQRLARRLCENCKTPADYPREAMLKAGFTPKTWTAVGSRTARWAARCNNGYKGRVGVYQVMPITEAIQRIILSRRHGDGHRRSRPSAKACATCASRAWSRCARA
jgi:type IV pilus assembly protein PilB